MVSSGTEVGERCLPLFAFLSAGIAAFIGRRTFAVFGRNVEKPKGNASKTFANDATIMGVVPRIVVCLSGSLRYFEFCSSTGSVGTMPSLQDRHFR